MVGRWSKEEIEEEGKREEEGVEKGRGERGRRGRNSEREIV